MADVRYPEIKVRLIGKDGNAFSVLGIMKAALYHSGISKEEINEFMGEAMKGDYNHLLQTCMKWVEVK